jgi:protein tyrosine/serine phosphatase
LQLLAVDGTFNIRASGSERDGKIWLVRSASLDAISTSGQQKLTELGIGVVIDLRDDAERTKTAHHEWPVVHLPIYQSIDGPPIVGSLDSVYRFILDERGDQVAAAVIAIARSEVPVLVHCTAGKDRTGLVVALAQIAAGQSREEAIDDYVLSGSDVGLHRREIVESTLATMGLTAAGYIDSMSLHLDSPASALNRVLDYLDEGFGGVQGYLSGHGTTAQDFEGLKRHIGGGIS